MPYTVILTADIDAKSPVTDVLMDAVRDDLDWLKSALSDGASAAQTIDGSSARFRAAGTALTVDNNALISGNLTVTGTVSTGDFFRTSDYFNEWILGGF